MDAARHDPCIMFKAKFSTMLGSDKIRGLVTGNMPYFAV